MFQNKSFAAVLAAIFATAQASGQEADSSRLRQEQNLQPVEVRAIRAGSEAPFAKTELTEEDIRKQNLGQDLPYLLQYTPSVVVTSDAGAGVGYTGLRVRGSDLTRINVTLNGIPVNDAESQGTFFVDLPDLASSTSSIQLQRGVGTSTNGGGAFGATMSISNLQQMEQAGVEGGFSIGSFNTQKYTVKAGTGLLQNGWQFDVRLSRISSDGYIERSASDLKSLQLLAGWQASEKTKLRFMYLTGVQKTGQAWNGVTADSLSSHRRFNELGQKADGTFYDDQTDNYRQDYYQAFLDHKFSAALSLHLAGFLTRGLGYYNEYRLGEEFGDYGLPDFVAGTDTIVSLDMIRQLWLDNYYYGSVFSLLYEKNSTRLSLGGGWNQYDGEHYGFVKWAEYGVPADHRWYMLDSRKADLNLYAKAERSFGRLRLFADLQMRNVQYDINGFRKSPDLRPSVNYNFFNPKAGASFLISDRAGQRQRVYASVAVANKEPNRDDFEASPEELPKPERLYDAEAGYEVAARNWNFNANFYYMYYQDQLVLTGKINDVGAYTRTNVPESYRAGVELVAAARPLNWLNIQANATFSQNKIVNYTEYIDDYDNGVQVEVPHSATDIAFAPSTIFSGTLGFTPFRNLPQGRAFQIDLLGKYVGRQYLDNTSNESRSINPYFTTDLRLRYDLPLRPFKEVQVILALNNVLNKLYESNGYTFSYIYDGAYTTTNYYYPQAGFNWQFGVQVKW